MLLVAPTSAYFIYTVSEPSTVRWHGAMSDMVCLHVTRSDSMTLKVRRECWRCLQV